MTKDHTAYVASSQHSAPARVEARPERKYWIRTEGFDGFEVRAPSAGKAKWATFIQYDEAGYGHLPGLWFSKSTRFKRFLERTICEALGPVADGAPLRAKNIQSKATV